MNFIFSRLSKKKTALNTQRKDLKKSAAVISHFLYFCIKFSKTRWQAVSFVGGKKKEAFLSFLSEKY